MTWFGDVAAKVGDANPARLTMSTFVGLVRTYVA